MPGAAPRVPPCFSPLLPPIQAHTNHVIVLCFRRQFLDSDMPRYYLFPLVFFPPPFPLFLLSFSPIASMRSLPPEAALGHPAPHPSTGPIPPSSRPGTSRSLGLFCCLFGPRSRWLLLPLARLRPHRLIWVFFLLFDFTALPSLWHRVLSVPPLPTTSHPSSSLALSPLGVAAGLVWITAGASGLFQASPGDDGNTAGWCGGTCSSCPPHAL